MFRNGLSSPRAGARTRWQRLAVEQLEDRTVPSTVNIDGTGWVRTVNDHILGVNATQWDTALNSPQTRQMVQAVGLNLVRLPGGSTADGWHFDNRPSYSGQGTAASMALFIESVGAAGMVTLNYGTGSPQEAAACLAYFNAAVDDPTAIGHGPEWTTSWVDKDWRTAGYWADLRAAGPLAHDDGLNFLRISHPAPFAFHYYEVGNEIYGNWETDHHTIPHDPATYVTFARQFADLAAQIDPTITIGAEGSGTGGSFSQIPGNFTAQMLQQAAAQGFLPGFLIDHNYMYNPGQENDANLLLHTATDPGATGYGGPINWAGRAQAYRALLTRYLGDAGANVELLATEFNSVSSNPSNQTTSLVNGLWLADALGGILETEYNAAVFWDLRNGWDTSHYHSNLYGWRQGGDYGLLGTSNGSAPATGTYVPYPNYFAEQLLQKIVHTGDAVVSARSDDPNLSTYAVYQQNGHLDLLVINKSPTTDKSGNFQIANFQPSGQARFWQYGTVEDTAQSHTTDGHSSLTTFTRQLALTGSNFQYTLPHYSMTVIDLPPAGLPDGWSDADIGSPSQVGSTSSADGYNWTVVGGGADIWNSSDQFHFTWQPLSGDGDVYAQAIDVENTNAWAKAGVMLRDSTAAGAAFAALLLTPGNGVAFQWRASEGAAAQSANVTGITGPVWLLVTRTSDQFSGWYSFDTTNWFQVGAFQTITMTDTSLAGLAVTSHDDSRLATATFVAVGIDVYGGGYGPFLASPPGKGGGTAGGANLVPSTPVAASPADVSVAELLVNLERRPDLGATGLSIGKHKMRPVLAWDEERWTGSLLAGEFPEL